MENFRKIGTRIFSALISRDFGELQQMANNQHYGHQDGRPWETPSLVIWKASIFWVTQEIAEVPNGTEIQKDMNEAIHIGQFPMLLWEKVESYWIILNHLNCIEYHIEHHIECSEYLVVSVPSLIAQIDFLFDRLGGSLVLPRDDETPSDGAGGCGFEGNLQNSPTQWRFIAGNIQKHHRKYSWVMFHDHFWFEIGMCSNIQWDVFKHPMGNSMNQTWDDFHLDFHHDFLGNSGCPWEVHDNNYMGFPRKVTINWWLIGMEIDMS